MKKGSFRKNECLSKGFSVGVYPYSIYIKRRIIAAVYFQILKIWPFGWFAQLPKYQALPHSFCIFCFALEGWEVLLKLYQPYRKNLFLCRLEKKLALIFRMLVWDGRRN